MKSDKGQIDELIPKIIAEIGAVGKGGKNTQGAGYAYRKIDDVMGALQPLLGKYGVTVYPVVKPETLRVTQVEVGKNHTPMMHVVMIVEYHWNAPDGSEIVCGSTGEAMDSGDKACNKAMASALKYALTQTLMIPTDEPKDTEEHSPELSPPREPEPPAPVDLEKFQAVADTFLARHKTPQDAIAAIKALPRQMTLEAEAFINEWYETR